MAFYFLDTLGVVNDPALAVLEGKPSGIGLKWYRLAKGEAAADIWPPDARIAMRPDDGPKLCSLIGNTSSFLIVRRALKDAIEAHCGTERVEYLPLTILDPKGRVRSDDCFVVNPVGHHDCLDRRRSNIVYARHARDTIIAIHAHVLADEKLADAPPLFRLPEDPHRYIVNEALATTLREGGFSNIHLRRVSQKPALA